ncbi:alpha/beta hydrolase [Streptomyces albus]|nr:alpha/beta hydrolase [Streptomyces albus]
MSSTDLPEVTGAVLPKVSAVRVEEGERLRQVGLPGLTLTVRSRPPSREGLPPALYVHGLGGSSQNWSALMPLLADTVDGEALDLPGFGDSPPPDDGDYSVTAHARAVIRHLDAAGRGPVHLIGNSLGGAVSTRVAAARPDLVRTLTLVSPALPELRIQRSAVPTGLLALPGMGALLGRLARDLTAEQRTRGVLGLCYGDPARVSPSRSATPSRRWNAGWRCRTSGTPWSARPAASSTRTPSAASTACGARRAGCSRPRCSSTAVVTGSSATGWPAVPRSPSAGPGC